MFNETNIFELLNDKYVLPKKVKLFESFSGIGCQRMAFNRLGIEVEMIGISEIDKYAIKSYMAIHGETKNWGSICDIKGQDLPQIDVFTFSFPCTDLSRAGSMKGLSKDTRSGLVYQVLRILQELKQVDRLPKCLIMENVVDLVQVKFIRQFQEIQLELEGIGYKNYAQTLNAKNYGVAQNRDRIFMVSVLGEKYYEFPKPIKLDKRLKDYLDNNVEKKYLLSDKFIKGMMMENTKGYDRKSRFVDALNKDVEIDIANTVTTREGCVATSNYILVKENTLQGYDYATEGDCINISQPNSKTRRGRVGHQICQTITTQQELTVIHNKKWRRITEREAGRLMGVNDDEIEKMKNVISRSRMYKTFGNGIVVDVFSAILSTMKGE